MYFQREGCAYFWQLDQHRRPRGVLESVVLFCCARLVSSITCRPAQLDAFLLRLI